MRDENGEIIHGLVSSYTNEKCRCSMCTLAKAEHMRDYLNTHRDELNKKRRDRRANLNHAVEKAAKDYIHKERYRPVDHEVILSADLAIQINQFMVENECSTERVSRLCRVDSTTIRNILRGKYKFTWFSVADKILQGIDSNALYDGTLHVVPNPQISNETWLKRIQSEDDHE